MILRAEASLYNSVVSHLPLVRSLVLCLMSLDVWLPIGHLVAPPPLRAVHVINRSTDSCCRPVQLNAMPAGPI